MAGNKNSGNGGKAAKYGTQIAARTRGAILNTFDALERKGTILSEVLSEAFLANPLKFLDTASKYLPKDINLTTTNTNTAKSMSDDELADLIAERARKRKEQLEQQLRDKPVSDASNGA